MDLHIAQCSHLGRVTYNFRSLAYTLLPLTTLTHSNTATIWFINAQSVDASRRTWQISVCTHTQTDYNKRGFDRQERLGEYAVVHLVYKPLGKS